MPRPIRVPFTIPYGAQFGAVRAGGKRRHNGTDYHCPIGTPIYGTEEGGHVTAIGYSGDPWLGAGHWVKIIYPSGSTTDMHMRERTRLSVGSPVGTVTLIGYVGLTGNAVNASPPGSHVHHERRKTNGLLVNPEVLYGSQPAAIDITPIEDPRNETDMPYLIRTAQHGHYTVSPGVVISHPDVKVTAGIEFRKWATVMDIAPADLAPFLFALGGCPSASIPAPGAVWYGNKASSPGAVLSASLSDADLARIADAVRARIIKE